MWRNHRCMLWQAGRMPCKTSSRNFFRCDRCHATEASRSTSTEHTEICNSVQLSLCCQLYSRKLPLKDTRKLMLSISVWDLWQSRAKPDPKAQERTETCWYRELALLLRNGEANTLPAYALLKMHAEEHSPAEPQCRLLRHAWSVY